jgi:Flp pilus assembly protein TadB
VRWKSAPVACDWDRELVGSARYARRVSGLQKRGSYTPRRERERRANQLVVGGGVAGLVGVVGLVLAVVGVVGATLPILALVVAAICAFLFRRVVAG